MWGSFQHFGETKDLDSSDPRDGPLVIAEVRGAVKGEQLNSSGTFSQDLHHSRFSRGSRMICKSGTSNNLEIGSSSCLCSTTSIGQEKETKKLVFRMLKNSRRTRRDSHRDIGRFSALETKRSGMEIASTNLRESGIQKLLRWYRNSRKQGHSVFTSAIALSR